MPSTARPYNSVCAAGAPRAAPDVDDTHVGRVRRCAQRDRGRSCPCAPAGPPPYSLWRGAGRGGVGGAAGRTSPPRCAGAAGVCRSVTARQQVSFTRRGAASPGRGRTARPGRRPRTCAAGPGIPASGRGAGPGGLRPSSVIALQRPIRCRGGSGPPTVTSKEHAGEFRSCAPPTGQRSAAPRRPGRARGSLSTAGRRARAGCAVPRVALLAGFSERRGPGPLGAVHAGSPADDG